tara:strand:+ start:63 stop:197 length:135 start_codon:yes stop_codon:yes gene_type:complete
MEHVNFFAHTYRIPTPVVELVVLLIGFVWVGIWLQGAYPEEDDK